MDHPTALSRVLQTPELLCRILAFLPQGNLLQLQRVSQTWGALIRTDPSLCAITFTGSSPARDTTAIPPRLNTLVMNRLRWCPSLDLSEVNSTRFHSVASDPILQAMAYENASWKGQYVIWPPGPRLEVIHGNICQEEPSVSALNLTCDPNDPDLSRGSEEEVVEEGEEPPPMVLCVLDFPHNQGRQCTGITVWDVLYGLRLHYLGPNNVTMQFWLGPRFAEPRGGKILAHIPRGKRMTVDVSCTIG